MYKIGDFSKIVGVSPSTLRNWHSKDILIPEYVSPSKTRYYSSNQIDMVNRHHTSDSNTYHIVGYCNIDSNIDLEIQVKAITQYISEHNGSSLIFIEDVSLTNYDRLKKVINLVLAERVSDVVIYDTSVLDEDMFEIIHPLLKDKGVTVSFIEKLK